MFHELDHNDLGLVTKEDLLACISDRRMVAFASAMDIEAVDFCHFFNILSMGGKTALDLETFVDGCIRMRGQARSMDVFEISLLLKDMLRMMTDAGKGGPPPPPGRVITPIERSRWSPPLSPAVFWGPDEADPSVNFLDSDSLV